MAPPREIAMTTVPRRRFSDEAGMTVIEVVVAALILVIGAIAVMSAVDTAARSTYRAEQNQIVVNRLQQELERVRQLPFNQVGLTSVPTHDTDQTNPNWRVSGTSYALGRNGTSARPMVYNGGTLYGGGTVSGGALSTGPLNFESGDVHGKIYRYVVWLNDDSCPEALCPGSQDAKRVIVAALLDRTASGGQRVYQEIHADITDPDAHPVENALPPGEDENSTWQFWLTDTPCDEDTRQPITADHATHNTQGVCSDGAQSGVTRGAPDLMFTESPPLDPDFPPDAQPLFDYGTDVEPVANPDQDTGLQMKHPTGDDPSGCLPFDINSVAEPNEQWKIHKWLSPPIPDGFDVQLAGRGALSIWTQTINGAAHNGQICVWLFTREVTENAHGAPVEVDTPVVNLDDLGAGDHFRYVADEWPSGEWNEVVVPMHFAAPTGGAVHLVPGARVGVAIGIHKTGTAPGEGLQFNYDTPSFDSRLELDTNSELPSF